MARCVVVLTIDLDLSALRRCKHTSSSSSSSNPALHLFSLSAMYATLSSHHLNHHRDNQVIIITNSDEGWVKYSAERYLPNLIPILQSYRIISARTRYEKFYPNQPLCWKAAAFAHEVNEHFCLLEEAHSLLDRECRHAGLTKGSNNNILHQAVSDSSSLDDSIPDMDLASTDESSLEDEDHSIESTSESLPHGSSSSSWKAPKSSSATITPPRRGVIVGGAPSVAPSRIRREVISFGDSIEERTAVKIVSDQLDALPKSVKFIHSPTPIQIIGQLTLLTHHMKFVCDHVEELDLEITVRQAEKCASGYLAKRGLIFPGTTRRTTGPMDPPAAGDANMDVSDL